MHHQAVLNVFHTVGLDDFDACVKVLEPEDTRQIFEEKFKRFVKDMDMVMPNPKANPYISDLKKFGDACVKVLEPEDTRQIFEEKFKRFVKDMDMVMPNPKANPYISDLKKFGKIRQAAKNLYRAEGMDISDYGEKVRKVVEDYLVVNHIEVLHEPINLMSDYFNERLEAAKTPETNSDYGEKVRKVVEDYLVVNHIEVLHEPINLMSDYFNERLEAAKTPETKAAEMEHALKHEIRVKLGSDPIYQTLMERLEELIRRRREHQLQIA